SNSSSERVVMRVMTPSLTWAFTTHFPPQSKTLAVGIISSFIGFPAFSAAEASRIKFRDIPAPPMMAGTVAAPDHFKNERLFSFFLDKISKKFSLIFQFLLQGFYIFIVF